jgi:hypothetical protein
MRSFTLRVSLGFALTTLTVAACEQQRSKLDEPPSPTTTTAAPPSGSAATATAPTAHAADDDGVSGVVVETMDSGGYTYAKLDRGDKQVWVAGPETKIVVGVKIGKVKGTLMPNFHSTTLDRTFDEIYFVNELPVTGDAMPNPHTSGGTTPAAVPATEKIERVAGGKTISELFANKAALAGKPVTLRAKVIKVNNGILGRNWLHVQDGTGSAGTNDLVVTTQATVAKGDVVVIRGTFATDKDFGGGYRYGAIVEDATIATK